MSDITFRSKAEPAVEILPEGKTPTRSGDEGERVAVPYLDYEKGNNHPFTVDYFKLGKDWDDPVGGFPEELAVIEEYFRNRIEKGEIANSRSAVEGKLKEIEKINRLKDEERITVKVETIAAYVRFLMEAEKISFNARRYGRSKPY